MEFSNKVWNGSYLSHCTVLYYTLQSSLQIQRSALLDDGTSRAGDVISGKEFIEGFYHIRGTFECEHVIYALKLKNWYEKFT